MPIRVFLLTVAMALGSGCAGRAPETAQESGETPTEETATPARSDSMQAPWKITYADGSGNATTLWRDAAAEPVHLQYTPVTPEVSSSGTYSGGEPRQGDVPDSEAGQLERWVQRLEQETSSHAEARAMGTGQLRIEVAGDERTIIIAPGPTLDQFDAYVRELGQAVPPTSG